LSTCYQRIPSSKNDVSTKGAQLSATQSGRVISRFLAREAAPP
jgi:hypothetical protein